MTTVRVPSRLRAPEATYREAPASHRETTIFAPDAPIVAAVRPRGRGRAVGAPAPPPSGRSAPTSPPVANSFDSTDFDTNADHTGFVFIPPDAMAAVGPDHVVNVTNVTVRFHQKDGTLDFDDSSRGLLHRREPRDVHGSTRR